MATHATKLTLGPILFHWPAERKRDFYARIADEAPIDTVYLGEVVCSKRAPFFDSWLPEVAAKLERAGKKVVFSTLALVMSEREIEAVRAMAEDSGFLVEANDISAVRLFAGRPHVIGPFVNVYNEGTLRYLARNGATRVVLSNELPAHSLAALAEAAGNVELEVQAFGRLPLALSARCYHARSRGLHKDSCQYVCADDLGGMPLKTLDEKPFFAVNGIQTLSYTVCNLVQELGALRDMTIGYVRLWPQAVDMVAVADVFRSVLDGKTEAREGEAILSRHVDFAPFSNGYFHGREGAAYAQ
ncbi:MAG: U32 family peptidase [Rhodospirillales bacterium]|nr:U32 family peptidase [Rhodospirillales bacterium]